MRARTRDGWDGRVAALDRSGRRATLEAGTVRVRVPVDELLPLGDGWDGEPALAARERAAPGAPASLPGRVPKTGRKGEFGATPSIRPAGSGARTTVPLAAVARTVDLRGARVDEALDMLDAFLDQAALSDAEQVTVVHGSGTGALRDAVRGHLDGHPQVRAWRPGGQGEGGDGATIVSL